MHLEASLPFLQARAKHLWGQVRIRELENLWRGFLDSDFCDLRVETDPFGGQIVRMNFIKAAPFEIPLILGDAIHNLRSALDYVVSELLGWKDTRLTFPAGETFEELLDSFRTQPEVRNGRTVKKGRNAALEVAFPGLGRFILDELEPFKSGKKSLWVLNKLDGRDKHRLLAPLIVPRTISDIEVLFGEGSRISIGSYTTDSDGIAALGIGGLPNVRISKFGKATAEMIFHEPGIIENQPVLPTLAKFSQDVADAIEFFTQFVIMIGWTSPGYPSSLRPFITYPKPYGEGASEGE